MQPFVCIAILNSNLSNQLPWAADAVTMHAVGTILSRWFTQAEEATFNKILHQIVPPGDISVVALL
jgi:hypothetical protein